MFGTPARSTEAAATPGVTNVAAAPGVTNVTVTVVQTSGCHFCAEAEESLAVLAARYPFYVSVVDLESPEGVLLTRLHRPAMNPLVLVDGRFFSAGRLPRKKLTALLDRATGGTVQPNGS